MAYNTSSYPEVNQSVDALTKMKLEIASELGISNYDKIDKGDLPARLHGKIGGNMVRRMITNYERLLTEHPELASANDPVADSQLQQDKEYIQRTYSNTTVQ